MGTATIPAGTCKMGTVAAAHPMTTGGPPLAVTFIALYHPRAGCLPVRYRPQRSKYEVLLLILWW